VPGEVQITRLVVLAFLDLGQDRIEQMVRFVLRDRVGFDGTQLAADAVGRGDTHLDVQVRRVEAPHGREQLLDIQRPTDHLIPLSSMSCTGLYQIL
jgi:hypothetical protein